MKQKNKGITLIALVITIIVLLILATISIATLTGDEGILTQATRAGEETEKGREKEIVELSYTNACTNGDVTKKTLEEEVKKYDSGATVTPKGKNFEIKFSSGNIYTVIKGGTIQNGSVVTAEEVNAKIGQVVDYQESETLSDKIKQQIGGWRIFYASDDEMFLISSGTISSSDAFAGNSGIPLTSKKNKVYTGAKDVFATDYGARYNSMWKEKGSTNDAVSSKSTAYLCDPANWIDYVGKDAPEGTYAVGGPTKELLVRSWVASGQAEGEKEEELKTILEDTTVSADGYVYNKPTCLCDGNPIKNTILPNTKNKNEGLYCGGVSYWLASPANASNGVCGVSQYGGVDWFYCDRDGRGVRPLVSIPMTNIQIDENGTIRITN